MKTILSLLILATALAAQVKTELCWRVTDARGTRESCVMIPAALRASLAQMAAEPSGPTPAPTSENPNPQPPPPLYRGSAHLISLTLINGLFAEALAKYAPAVALKLEATANTAWQQAKDLRTAALPAVPGAEP